MTELAKDTACDFSVLDPDTVTSSSTPRLFKRADILTTAQQDVSNGMAFHSVDNASAYSLHLSAIDPHSPSSTVNLDVEITRLESEDIGGPSDFTQNLAEWINGTKIPAQGAEESRAYRNPTVEESDTPLPPRSLPAMHIGAGPRSPQQSIDSSVTTQQDWQALYEDMKSKNERLNQILEMHRLALAELKHANKTACQESARLEEQVSKWEFSTNRPLADSTTLGHEHTQTPARPSNVMDRASLALSDQQTRIEELESTLAQHKSASTPVVDERSSHQQIELLESRLVTVETSHKEEIAALRREYQDVAADVDEWVVEKVKAKEEQHSVSLARRDRRIGELKARNAELEQAYTLCGKELMLAWGREECGAARPGQKQPYRYRHALRST